MLAWRETTHFFKKQQKHTVSWCIFLSSPDKENQYDMYIYIISFTMRIGSHKFRSQIQDVQWAIWKRHKRYPSILCFYFLFFKILFIYLFIDTGGGRKTWRETSMCKRFINQLPLAMPLTGDLACNPGMGPDWELNQ